MRSPCLHPVIPGQVGLFFYSFILALPALMHEA